MKLIQVLVEGNLFKQKLTELENATTQKLAFETAQEATVILANGIGENVNFPTYVAYMPFNRENGHSTERIDSANNNPASFVCQGEEKIRSKLNVIAQEYWVKITGKGAKFSLYKSFITMQQESWDKRHPNGILFKEKKEELAGIYKLDEYFEGNEGLEEYMEYHSLVLAQVGAYLVIPIVDYFHDSGVGIVSIYGDIADADKRVELAIASEACLRAIREAELRFLSAQLAQAARLEEAAQRGAWAYHELRNQGSIVKGIKERIAAGFTANTAYDIGNDLSLLNSVGEFLTIPRPELRSFDGNAFVEHLSNRPAITP